MINFILTIFAIIIALGISYSIVIGIRGFCRYLTFDSFNDSNFMKVNVFLLKVLSIIIKALFFYPLILSIFLGIKEAGDSLSIVDSVVKELKSNGLFLILRLIPIEIILLLIVHIIKYLDGQSILNEKKREIKNRGKTVDKAVNSLEKISSIEMTDSIKDLITRQKAFISDELPEYTPKIVNLTSVEQYDFIKNQSTCIKQLIRDIIINESIFMNNSIIRNIAEDNESSIESLLSALLNELKKCEEIPKHIWNLYSLKNGKEFFKPLYDFCHSNNLYFNIQQSVYYYKSLYYQKMFHNIFEDLNKQSGIAKKGYLGEQKVSEHLKLYKDVLINLENVRFGVEDTTVEADNIIICENGVFCIETKNYGKAGETIVVTKDGRWKRFRGNNEINMSNVSEQHNRHIGIMQRTVNEELKRRGYDVPYVYFEPIYVIANDEVEIENNSSEIALLRASSIYPYIRKFEVKNSLSKELQEVIKDVILEYRKDLKKYPITDYGQTFKFYLDNLAQDYKDKKIAIKIYEEYLNIIESSHEITFRQVGGDKYIEIV